MCDKFCVSGQAHLRSLLQRLYLVNFWSILVLKEGILPFFSERLHLSKLDLFGQHGRAWNLKTRFFLFLMSDQCSLYDNFIYGRKMQNSAYVGIQLDWPWITEWAYTGIFAVAVLFGNFNKKLIVLWKIEYVSKIAFYDCRTSLCLQGQRTS